MRSSLPRVIAIIVFFGLILLWSYRDLARSASIPAGKESYESRMCRICHSINGQGGKIGPDLTQVATRRKLEWLRRWLKDPAPMLPDTDMIKVPWDSEAEIENMIAYLLSLKKNIDKQAAFKLGEPIEVGKEMVRQYDCRSCHNITTGGRVRYPDLSGVGSKRSAEWLKTWLKDPQKVKPGTFMPTFPLEEKEIDAIVAFLAQLK